MKLKKWESWKGIFDNSIFTIFRSFVERMEKYGLICPMQAEIINELELKDISK